MALNVEAVLDKHVKQEFYSHETVHHRTDPHDTHFLCRSVARGNMEKGKSPFTTQIPELSMTDSVGAHDLT